MNFGGIFILDTALRHNTQNRREPPPHILVPMDSRSHHNNRHMPQLPGIQKFNDLREQILQRTLRIFEDGCGNSPVHISVTPAIVRVNRAENSARLSATRRSDMAAFGSVGVCVLVDTFCGQ